MSHASAVFPLYYGIQNIYHHHPYIASATMLSDSFISVCCLCAEECDLL